MHAEACVWARTKGVGKVDNKSTVNHRINMISLPVSVLVFGTGLILMFWFHVGEGAHRMELLGLKKALWLDIHLASSIAFFVCSVIHIHMHWKHITTVVARWNANLPKKTKSTTREQVLMFIAAAVVLWAGFYAWIGFPEGTLENREYHRWIDIHNRVGLVFLIGMGVHIKRRWRRIFPPSGSSRRATHGVGK
jgi:hypothetical protein